MSDQDKKNHRELNIIASLVEDYCTTTETTVSSAVKRLMLELNQSKASEMLLKHKVAEYERLEADNHD